ncbi:MAG TPA: substrate-binding domain-containing protein, partial [Acidimicrobiales bacterium]|nr:substrate-binding domain-containing protein [Acidimicrobiales bacterium]
MTPHRPSCRYLVAAGFVLALTGGALPLVLAGPASAASSPSGAAAVSSTNPASAGSVPPTTTAAGPTGASGPTTPSTTTPSTTTSSTTTPSTASTSSQTPSGVTTTTAAPTPQPKASTGLIGDGSSFAGPEILGWASDVFKAPYNLTINFTSDSSGQGRFDFGSGTVDFAVSDIPYQGLAFDTAQPSFKFIYVPVTAGGVAFMYHLNGLPSGTTLQLSSYTICAMMTGGITTWNNQYIQEDNPGVSLPATPIHPVIRSDLAGTNFVLQEYCIHEQPALWKAFIDATATQQYPGQVGDLSDSQPRSDWPLFPGAILASGSANAADDVANPKVDGYFTAVETTYAIQRGFPVASVKNASGAYTQPSAVGVASALAYATQNSNGTHNLNFDGIGPHVYNPSTYSYLLTPTQGWSAAKGATMSQFVNYALTLGQQKAPQIGYA